MSEYMVVPESLLDQEDRLRQWVTKALLYGESLKPKTKAEPEAKKPAKKRK
jgi:hypothetical protein